MGNIQLKPTKEWTEKSKECGFRQGSLRLYVGSLHVGTAEPIRGDEDNYHFHSMLSDITLCLTKRASLDEIKTNIELALKEFANKFIQAK